MDRPTILRGKYTLRPWRASDLPSMARLDVDAFTPPHSKDNLFEILFPGYEKDRSEVYRGVEAILRMRYYSVDCFANVLEDLEGNLVGFTAWKTTEKEGFWSWFSPKSWFNFFARSYIALYLKLFPMRDMNPHTAGAMFRTVGPIEKELKTTQRRKEAWYLSVVAVDPAYQGQGLGRLLLEEGLKVVDKVGAAVWLVGLRDLEGLYQKFGFKTLARANVGEMADWKDSGYVMFRE